MDNSESVKLLGVKWRPADDILIFDLSNLHSIAIMAESTKRKVIGLCARFYDPLGFVSPVTVCFKMLFQDICTAKLDLDRYSLGWRATEEVEGITVGSLTVTTTACSALLFVWS